VEQEGEKWLPNRHTQTHLFPLISPLNHICEKGSDIRWWEDRGSRLL